RTRAGALSAPAAAQPSISAGWRCSSRATDPDTDVGCGILERRITAMRVRALRAGVHSPDRHPRSETGAYPGLSVFDHQALRGREPEPLRGDQVALRIRLAAGHGGG